MENRSNGDLGPWSRYRDQTTRGSRSSSSSGYTSAGTIVSISTGYTSNSSRLSSISSLGLEAAIHLDLELDEDRCRPTKMSRREIETSKEKQKQEKMHYQKIAKKEMEEIKILIQQFLGAPSPSPAVDGSLKAKGGDIGVFDWWLKHLGVGWVLDIADDASAGILLDVNQAWSWIRALAKITQTICFMASLCPDHGSVGLPPSAEQQQQPEAEIGNKDSIPDLFQFAQFIQETMLKMLAFVDVMVAPNAPNVDKLSTLLSVHGAMSESLSPIQWLFHPRSSGGVERIHDNKLISILATKETMVAEAIWSIMEQTRTGFIEDRDVSSCSLNTQASSDVYKATRFLVRYIKLLCSHYRSGTAVVSEAASLGKYVRTGNVRPFDNMIRQIASCLQEKLINISESFPDHGLRCLFLLNNSYFIMKELHYTTPFSLQEKVTALFGKVERYIMIYLETSWAPVLSCLLNPTPLCFGRSYCPLPKFESEFQNTYTTQKLWKVPDPQLKQTLREAITEKIVPGYKKYIEDNKITNPKFSPQELKEMLQELFEGW